MNYEPFTSIKNLTLAHFRHFSSLFTLSPLYICRESSTNQLLFMQNKPNFQKSQMNVNLYNTRDYENKWQRRVRKNKPNSNPIKPNLKRAQININSIITKDYRKKDDFTVRINKPNSNPISEKPKMNTNAFSQKDYENETTLRPKKTNPNKPNFKPDAGFSVHYKRDSQGPIPSKGQSGTICLISSPASYFIAEQNALRYNI